MVRQQGVPNQICDNVSPNPESGPSFMQAEGCPKLGERDGLLSGLRPDLAGDRSTVGGSLCCPAEVWT